MQEFVNTITAKDIISIIGCITGVLGLAISINNALSRRKKLKITFFDKKECIYFDKLKNHSDCNTKKQAIALLQIQNKSSLPITIHTIRFALNKEKSMPHRFYPFENIVLPESKDTFERTTRISIDTSGRQLELPIKLNAYEATKGYMFLSFFVFDDNLPHKIKVEFGTTRHQKRLTRKCIFRPFTPISIQDVFDPNLDYKW